MSKERLTKRKYGEIVSSEKEIQCSNFCNKCSQGSGNCKYVKEMIEKLAEYEDLEEQGLLLRLPCKVGDTVYYILGIPQKTPCVVEATNFELQDINKIGKTVFLTQSEAEEKLRELEKSNV